jgi:hypothetical protein
VQNLALPQFCRFRPIRPNQLVDDAFWIARFLRNPGLVVPWASCSTLHCSSRTSRGPCHCPPQGVDSAAVLRTMMAPRAISRLKRFLPGNRHEIPRECRRGPCRRMRGPHPGSRRGRTCSAGTGVARISGRGEVRWARPALVRGEQPEVVEDACHGDGVITPGRPRPVQVSVGWPHRDAMHNVAAGSTRRSGPRQQRGGV